MYEIYGVVSPLNILALLDRSVSLSDVKAATKKRKIDVAIKVSCKEGALYLSESGECSQVSGYRIAVEYRPRSKFYRFSLSREFS